MVLERPYKSTTIYTDNCDWRNELRIALVMLQTLNTLPVPTFKGKTKTGTYIQLRLSVEGDFVIYVRVGDYGIKGIHTFAHNDPTVFNPEQIINWVISVSKDH